MYREDEVRKIELPWTREEGEMVCMSRCCSAQRGEW